jgi:ATP-dependent exoDNAse (exonuclease V) beta subunit
MQIEQTPTSSALPPFPHFILVSASAGSGKTYQLAWRIVHLLLTGVPFEQVLAVTFTNNAAAEMKQRVLLFLKQLALKQEGALAEAEKRLGALPDDVADTASLLISRILERYDEFQITTIDSFMVRLYRASALEFGRDPSFEVLLSKDDAIAEAFDVLASSITEGSDEARQFEALIEMERESFPWNPYRNVRREVVDLHRTLRAHGNTCGGRSHGGGRAL